MSFLKKTWLARIGVGLNRFRMNNSTDVVLESNPVSVTQQGDQLSADNMNNLETRIDNAFTEMAGNLAPIEVSPATTNHAVGTQLVYNGILYKVTSAISTGNNLVVGSNISPYPVSSALSDISASISSVTTLLNKNSDMTTTTPVTFVNGEKASNFLFLIVEVMWAGYASSMALTVLGSHWKWWGDFNLYLNNNTANAYATFSNASDTGCSITTTSGYVGVRIYGVCRLV